ncbi:MAG: helix-turn-helix transcriptional regulator [Bacteroidaceae bacterium]|nr:helix-turn-helix transcriptional regulator [Prevotellaceae bacterium]MDY5630938.1 helix-turn-helix transcriptional regulator [Bacteroidaceae bacterium]
MSRRPNTHQQALLKDFANKLVLVRTQLGLTQEALANATGTSQSRISAIESGNVMTSVTILPILKYYAPFTNLSLLFTKRNITDGSQLLTTDYVVKSVLEKRLQKLEERISHHVSAYNEELMEELAEIRKLL